MLRLSVVALLCVSAITATTTQCPSHPTTGCSEVHWDPVWDMAGSGYVYCYNNCPLPWLNQNRAEVGVFHGLVGVDHYYTKQGMPCVNGLPHEFASQDNFTIQTKAAFPGTRVLQYRITDAVPYAPIVLDTMNSNPEYVVRFTNGSVCLMPPEHKTEGFNCNWSIQAAAYDWSNPAAQEWFLDNIIKPAMVHADGVWLDGDGPDNGAYKCSGSYNRDKLLPPYPALNDSQTDAFCKGEAQVVDTVQRWLIANNGFEYDCIHFITSNLPASSDSPSTCASKVEALTKVTNPNVVLYGSRTAGSGYTDETVTQAVATFLLTRQEHWWFGYPSADTYNSTTAKVLLSEYGAPLTNMTTVSTNVFQRKFEKAIVELDCNTFSATFTEV